MRKIKILTYCILLLLLITNTVMLVAAKKGGGGGVPCDGLLYGGGHPPERGACITECGSPSECDRTQPGGKGPGCETGQTCSENCGCEWVDRDLDSYTTTTCDEYTGWSHFEEADIREGEHTWILDPLVSANSFRIIQTKGTTLTKVYSVKIHNKEGGIYEYDYISEPYGYFELSKINELSESFEVEDTVDVIEVAVNWDDVDKDNKARLELFTPSSTTCDCDDYNPYIYPEAQEICDNADNDCDGKIDEDAICEKTIHLCKSDNFIIEQEGNDENIRSGYCADGEWYSGGATGEKGSFIYETKEEDIGQNKFYTYICDSNNCYKFTEGSFMVCGPGWDCETICVPGECNDETKEYCNEEGRWVSDPDIYSAACLQKEFTFYRDFDGDGYGHPLRPRQDRTKPTGYVIDNTDCNDYDKNVNPGAPDECDGKDNDCDERIDEGTPEICNGIDDDCDGGVDAIDGKPLQIINSGRETYQLCENGIWETKTCAAQEDCSNKIDNDCDTRIPELDLECVKRGWTRPSSDSHSKRDYDWLGRCSCDADAWNIPDFYYNPAQHSLWDMNPSDWGCIPSKTYYGDAASMFVAEGWSFVDIGSVWIANKAYESIPEAIKPFFKLFIGDGIGKLKKYADDLPQPNAWAYAYCIGTNGLCKAWATVYSFKRDWICFHNTFTTEKIWDWSNKNGDNWMTPVRDQGDCASCWAHSVLGAVEAKYNIENNNPYLNIDLSEQELVSCSDAGDCISGGSISIAIDYIKNNEIRTETCFPYQAQDVPCTPSCDTKYGMKDYQLIETEREAMKLALRKMGPLSICMDWGNFMTWDGNILRCDGQKDESGHCVILVGYNDYDGYWIIKNSYGLGWGDKGYGKVGYGECGIETFGNSPFGIV